MSAASSCKPPPARRFRAVRARCAAQAYPSRSVRVVVPVGAGGANDTSTRLIAQKLSESLRQQFYVENIVGAGGNIGMAQALKAAPDGYTVLSVAPSFVINPSSIRRPVRSGEGLRAGDADVLRRRP